MKKKKQRAVQSRPTQANPEQREEKLLLKDRLNLDVLNQFKEKQEKWKEEADQKEEAARQKRLEEQKQREKNKSFEELLNESSLNWKQFK